MKYKGYTGVVEFDESVNVLFGRVVGLRDVITFQGESVAEVIRAFQDSVDVYLEYCAEQGKSPERPYSGKFLLRVEPELHRTMTQAAEARNVSLNAIIESTLEKAFKGDQEVQQSLGGRSGSSKKLGGKKTQVGPIAAKRK